MTQTGSVWNAWVTLRDRDTIAGSRLFSGNTIYCYVNDMSFIGQGVFGEGETNMIAIDYTHPLNNNVGSEWNKVIAYNSFTGVNNNKVILSGTWVTDLGSTNSLGSVLTPYKCFIFGTSGKRLYLTDERIISQIAVESGSQVYGNGSGMPVVVTQYSIKTDKQSDNAVNWSLTLSEDKV